MIEKTIDIGRMVFLGSVKGIMVPLLEESNRYYKRQKEANKITSLLNSPVKEN